MRTITIRALAIGALAIPALAGSAAPQTPSSPMLNALQVRTLVTSSQPADNARLSAHFTALAERYTAEAKRHGAMAQAFIAAPTRRVAANTAADHCKRLVELNTQSADTVRQLAAHHQRLAAGAPSTPPKGGSWFQSGAGAPEPSDADLSALAAKANTRADHLALEEYFLTAAKRYTAEASEHVAMAQAYRGTRIAQAAAYCDRLVTLSRDSAKEATAAPRCIRGWPASLAEHRRRRRSPSSQGGRRPTDAVIALIPAARSALGTADSRP